MRSGELVANSALRNVMSALFLRFWYSSAVMFSGCVKNSSDLGSVMNLEVMSSSHCVV